jgi:glycosyltransferase involved in cell wall biosynthesis
MVHQKINILFLIDSLSTRDGFVGGTERQLVQVLNRLDRQRFKPILVCLREDPKSLIWDIVDCEKHNLNVYSLRSIRGIIKLLSFMKFLKKSNINIVQTYFFDSTFFGMLAANAARVSIPISCRRDMGFWYNNSLLWKINFVNKFTKRILVNSNAIKELVIQKEKFPAENIDVIHNGIDLNEIQSQPAIQLYNILSNIKKTDKIVGIVGNYNRRIKRFDLFIMAAAEVLKKMDNVKFLIIGGGNYESELKLLADDLGISQNIFFIGKKDNSICYIKSFDVGVLSSDSEGFPNVILEYMACGIPVVATSVGGTVELIEDGVSGILVQKGDCMALADSISRLLMDENLGKRLGQNGQKYISDKFSWDMQINKINKYYSQLFLNSSNEIKNS